MFLGGAEYEFVKQHDRFKRQRGQIKVSGIIPQEYAIAPVNIPLKMRGLLLARSANPALRQLSVFVSGARA
ncbi:hypothetical protein PM02_00020 [Sulfitobacter mediterraneus]|uniref:Uncharacterized protein n=1 Tax=Sulfitobacter mediterraneus TaxID=83219 RepID=A0A061SXZ3_9RHOB|nr:hypothetical protein PM02_00020 [Sulfitobacter mediterraneus]